MPRIGLPSSKCWPTSTRISHEISAIVPSSCCSPSMACGAVKLLLCGSTRSIGWGEPSELVRLKRRQPQISPLLPAVAEALARYIDAVRPPSSCQEVFLCMQAPLRPLKAGSIFDVANRQFVSLGIEAAHRGGHALRHACAVRLLAEGLIPKALLADS